MVLFSSILNAGNVTEQDIKAVYLYNFLRFVTWPEADNQDVSAKSSVAICILGNDDYSKAFKAVENQPLKSDHRILVIDRLTTFSTINQLLHCQLLFITASEHPQSQTIINALQKQNILLIGESLGFIEAGGMMEFHRVADKIRWRINLTAATRAGFKIDRRLLRSATQVIQKTLNDNIDLTKQALPQVNQDQSLTTRDSNGERL